MNLVLVHLNSKIPSHLVANLAYLKRTFPRLQVHLVGDELTDKTIIPAGIEFINYENLQIEMPVNTDSTNLNPRFRSGFWMSSKIRLLILSQLISLNRMSEVLHVESDVWLSPSFPFDYFSSIQEDLAFPLADENRGVASTLWIAGSSGAQLLSRFVRRYWSETDMSILGKLAREKSVKILPSAYPDISRGTNTFWFDGAVIGMHLLGEDPRNNFGIIKRFQNVDGLEPNLTRASFSFNNVLLANYLGRTTEIVSVHNHLKTCRIYDLNPDKFWKKQLRMRNWQVRYSFSITAFLFAVRELGNVALNWGLKRVRIRSNKKNWSFTEPGK